MDFSFTASSGDLPLVKIFVTLSGSAALAAPVQADYLLASPARPDCVKYDVILSLSSDYRWMPEAFSSGRLCHSFSRAE